LSRKLSFWYNQKSFQYEFKFAPHRTIYSKMMANICPWMSLVQVLPDLWRSYWYKGGESSSYRGGVRTQSGWGSGTQTRPHSRGPRPSLCSGWQLLLHAVYWGCLGRGCTGIGGERPGLCRSLRSLPGLGQSDGRRRWRWPEQRTARGPGRQKREQRDGAGQTCRLRCTSRLGCGCRTMGTWCGSWH